MEASLLPHMEMEQGEAARQQLRGGVARGSASRGSVVAAHGGGGCAAGRHTGTHVQGRRVRVRLGGVEAVTGAAHFAAPDQWYRRDGFGGGCDPDSRFGALEATSSECACAESRKWQLWSQ